MKNRNLTMMTDFYELTMSQAYFNAGKKDEEAVFDAFFRKNPLDGGYAVMGGVDRIINFINNAHFNEDDIEYLRTTGQFTEEFLNYLKDFKFTGSMNPLNWATEGVPKIGVEWYAKGGIMQQPTVFGINPLNGKQMIGGEAGPEAVAPIDTLLGYIRVAVAEQNTLLVEKLEKLIDILLAYFPQFKELMNKFSFA